MGDLTSLILQAKEGDVAAYSAIVRRFQDTAVGYAYGILGNHDAAKDAAQEAFLEAYACLSELREPRAFSAWLRRIIFKQCDRITRRRTLTQVPLEVAEGVPTSAPGPVEIYEQRELQLFVANALQQLPTEQRLAITLFYLSGYSHQEVADFLNLTKSQVNNRLYHARNTLKERIFAMTKATLSEQRPSNDERFTNQVIDRIRLANPMEDFPRIAQLLSADALETTSAQDLLDEHKVDMPERILRHAVAINHQGIVVGFNFAGHYPSMKPGQYSVNVVVDAAHRQQGIGNQLWQDLLKYLQAQGANALLAEVQEGDPIPYQFAEKRGFTPRTHQLRAILDLQHFDEGKFAAITPQVEAMGIRLAAFADVVQSEENIRKLYDINGVAALDDPASDGAYINYENWKKVIWGASWFQPAGQMVALDGHKFVGLSAISYNAEEQTGYILISGVDAAYRNRKIMQALKLRAITYARTQGATRIVTNVETVNAPMRAINQKFGFLEEPGKYEMERKL
ncbi:MAG: GNAT family N-acetyltransferase [Caldilineaceae bacterium]|nr:GNAT family N-acetyltransferase [Caldilineaceae bacterium]